MSHLYKQIGISGKWVASLLALGTVTWWAVHTFYPQPQFEAENMHAVRERDYSMGRTTTQFTHTYTANVSVIITATVTVADTRYLVPSSTLNDGTYDYITSTNGTYFCGWVPGTKITWVSPGNMTLFNAKPGGRNALIRRLGAAPYYWYASLSGLFPGWIAATTNIPETLVPTSVAATGSLSFAWATKEDTYYKYVTNSPAHIDTNTIGFYPNATFQYPDSIRSAMDDANSDVATHSWLTPSNIFMQTGAWDGNPHGWSQASVSKFHDDVFAWTNYVTLSPGHYYTTTNYSTTNIVYTNYPPATNWFWLTNILWHSQLFTNDAATNAVSEGRLFAFERDSNKLYWSTNAYNDLARALSLMQWQHCDYMPYRLYGTDAAYGWHIYYYTNSVGTGVAADWSGCSFRTPRAILSYYYIRWPGGQWNKNYKGWFMNSKVYAYPAALAGTNFTFTNGYFCMTSGVCTATGSNPDGSPHAAGPFPGVPDLSWQKGVVASISPSNWGSTGEAVTSDWITVDGPTLPTQAWIDADFAATTAVWEADAAANPGTIREYYLVYGWIAGVKQIDYPYASPDDSPSATYTLSPPGFVVSRPIFQSLTNYLNHAPAR